MNAHTAEILRELDNRFYSQAATSFSRTREYPWQGWERVYEELGRMGADAGRLSVLDVACGNMRFERFADDACKGVAFAYHAVDSCEELACARGDTVFECRDVLAELGSGKNEPLFGTGRYDAAVCFGFMHHVYGQPDRRKLLESLFQAVKPGGLVAVSYWEFAQDERGRARAMDSTRKAVDALGIEGLEENDFILGWNGEEGLFRYCHSFSPVEVDTLYEGMPIHSLERYRADGKDGRSNEYVLARVAGQPKKPVLLN